MPVDSRKIIPSDKWHRTMAERNRLLENQNEELGRIADALEDLAMGREP